MSVPPPPKTRFSNDGLWWWDGTSWKPAVSPDRKWRWTGQRWVAAETPPPPPVVPAPYTPPPSASQPFIVSQQPVASNNTVVVAVSVIVVLVVVGLVWYFGFYDTAAGRCNRGDLGACLVYYAQAQASASASAAAAQASADAQASAAQQSEFAVNGCTVGPGDGSHDVRLTESDTVSSTVQLDTCNQLLQQGWAVAPVVAGATEVCQHVAQDGNTITVTDTGGQYYGGLACQQLSEGQLPSWPIATS